MSDKKLENSPEMKNLSFFSSITNFLKKVLSFFSFKKNISKPDDKARKQTDLDKKLVYSLSKSRIPTLKQFKYLNKFLSPKERKIIYISFFVLIINLILWGGNLYFSHLQTVPVRGGEYTEGLIGLPKYVNPLYAKLSDVDNDLSSLIYSSLFTHDKEGKLTKDLVEDYKISEDNKTYTFTIRKNVKWQDGTPLTVEDILFTYNAIIDKQYNSPWRVSFIGVKINKIDEFHFQFILTDPYAAFLELLTFGIMPAHLWAQIPPETAILAELNLKPVGSGPYSLLEITKDATTGIIKEYSLVVNENYYGKIPLVDLKFVFFQNFEEAVNALNDKTIDGISYLPQSLRKKIITPKTIEMHKISLPQLTLIFFNQENNQALKDKAVRQSLAYSINRQEIVNDILGGAGYLVDGPILPNSFAYYDELTKYDYNPEKARQLLDSADWKVNNIDSEAVAKAQEEIGKEEDPDKISNAQTIVKLGEGNWRKKDGKYLFIKLVTIDRNENQAILKAISHYWEEIGVKVDVSIVNANEIQKQVINPRAFEALFYGQVVGADPDPYAFWDSTQAHINGFNIANYNNKEVDQLLEDARKISDQKERRKKYIEFQKIITEEVPAIFMYSPTYTYVQDKKIKGFDVANIYSPQDRFANIGEWYIKTGKRLVWDKEAE